MFVACAVGILAAGPHVQAQSPLSPASRVTKRWETKAELKVPQAVVFDPARQAIFVANDAEEGGRGFISKVSLEGEIVALEWLVGVVAPRDLVVNGSWLYVSSVNELFEIDLDRARIRGRYLNDDSVDLKSVVATPTGEVYVSDRGSDTLFELRGGVFGEFIKDDRTGRSAALALVGKELFASVRNRVVAIDLKTQNVRTVFRTTALFNALVPVGNGSFLGMDSTGGIQFLGANGTTARVLLPATAHRGVSGLCYVPSERLLLVVAKTENKLVAYQVD